MPLVRLTEDGPFGKEGDEVWVDDPADVNAKPKAAAKKTAAAKDDKK